MTSSLSAAVRAGHKSKSASRTPEPSAAAAAAASSKEQQPALIDLTGNNASTVPETGPDASHAKNDEIEYTGDVLLMHPTAPRPRSPSSEIEVAEAPAKKPRLSSPAAADATSSSAPAPATAAAAGKEGVDSLFFFDDAPKAPKKKALWVEDSTPASPAEPAATSSAPADTLSLPSHIIIETAADPATGGADGMDVDAEEGGGKPLTEAEVFADDLGKIEFLDGGDDKPVQRYFDVDDEGEPVPVGKQHLVCSICKERGHLQRDCKTVICLTCGARDEHETRNCPVALICFACGGRGHRSKDCPAPRHMRQYRHNGPMCDRCGSDVHPGNNCPTLWRIYSYLTPDDRKQTLATRVRLHSEGGFEGDVLTPSPDDEPDGWCYNCAADDHYGDDCPHPRISRAPRPDFSAFSAYNSHNSPFWTGPATSSRPPRPKRSDRRGQPQPGPPPRARDLVVPDEVENVGWRGKQAAKQKAREYEQRRAAAEEADDAGSSWFDRPVNVAGPSSRYGGGEVSIKGKSSSAGGGKKDESAKKLKKKNRKDRRSSNENGKAREDDERPFVSGGSGTQLEEEYSQSFGGSNRSRSNSTFSNASTSRGGGRAGGKGGGDPPKQFSFKFGGGPPGGGGGGGGSASNSPAPSGIKPSTFSRVSGDRGSTAQGGSSLLSRVDLASSSKGDGSKGKAKEPKRDPRDALRGPTRAELRDLQRKEKERTHEVDALMARLGKKGGRVDYLDSPDRRGAGGGGGGGSGTNMPTGSKSRYQGGYR